MGKSPEPSNADSPTFSPAHQRLVLAKPHEESQSFDEFLDYVIDQETDPAFPLDAETRYAQTRQSHTLTFASPLIPLTKGCDVASRKRQFSG